MCQPAAACEELLEQMKKTSNMKVLDYNPSKTPLKVDKGEIEILANAKKLNTVRVICFSNVLLITDMEF